ncbi:MAG: hypothetical protein GY771_06275 [bacterium]|nr:hypothetical protein [bacterium]
MALLYRLYASLCDVLTAYFTPPRIPDADKLQRAYSSLYVAIESQLVKPGIGHLRLGCAIPFPSLYDPGEWAEAEWEGKHRRRVIESLATIEQQYYAAGSPDLPDDAGISDLLDEAKKTLKKYKKAQKKAMKKSRANLVPDTPASVRKPAVTGETGHPAAPERQERIISEKKPEKKGTTWKTIIIGIIIGIVTGTIARLIVYFVTRYLEDGLF